MQSGSGVEASSWLRTVAEVLPHRQGLPYLLGSAVAEMGAYAAAIPEDACNVRPTMATEIRYIRAHPAGHGVDVRELCLELVRRYVADVANESDQEGARRRSWAPGPPPTTSPTAQPTRPSARG